MMRVYVYICMFSNITVAPPSAVTVCVCVCVCVCVHVCTRPGGYSGVKKDRDDRRKS